MQATEGELIFSNQSGDKRIEVLEHDGLRVLRFDGVATQTAMSIEASYKLLLPYTRTMMSCLLFQPPPSTVLLLGLGGGAIVRYFRRFLPETRIRAVDNDATVVDVCRKYFPLTDSENVIVEVEDAFQFVQSSPSRYDILFVDLYDHTGMSSLILKPQFYHYCERVLSEHGILVVNLLIDEAEAFKTVLRGIRHHFRRLTLCVSVPDYRNIIVLAFKTRPLNVTRARLEKRATALRLQFELEFDAFVAELFKANPTHGDELLFEIR